MRKPKANTQGVSRQSVAIDPIDVEYIDEIDLQRGTIDGMMRSFTRALAPMVDANERARDKWWDDMKTKYGFVLATGQRLQLNRATMTLRILQPGEKLTEE